MPGGDDKLVRVRGGSKGFRMITLGQFKDEQREKRGKIKKAKSPRAKKMDAKRKEKTKRKNNRRKKRP